MGQQRRHGIPDLPVLFGSRPFKEIVVRKCLETCGFAHCQTSALCGIIVDEVVTIFRNMRYDGSRRTPFDLHAEPIVEFCLFECCLNISMLGKQFFREIFQQRRAPKFFRKYSGKQVAVKITLNVAT